MANPIIAKLMSSLINGQTSGKIQLLESGKGNRKFSSDMLKALHNTKNSAFQIADKPAEINMMSNSKGYKYYLESFRKELLAQGKPLSKTFLRENDLPLIKTFLLQCGFPHEKVEQFLKDLKSNNSNGEYNLSQIFLKITELDKQKREENPDKTVDPSTIPYIESILRDFNLSAKELDSVLSKARTEDGGLDLYKLTEGLKGINGRGPLKDKVVVDQNLSRQISEKMELIGMNMPKKAKTDQIGLEDFITSLEQITEKAGKEKNVSPDIKNTLGKISERAKLSEQKSEFASSLKVSSNYDFTEPLLKEKADKKGHNVDTKKVLPSLEKSKSGKNESISSFIKQKEVKVKNYAGPHTNTSNRSEKADMLPNVNKQTELISPINEKGYHANTEAGQINASENSEAFSFTNMLKTVEQGEKPLRGYIPVTLVDQVGKQISKSILRGDQFVTLQLKPPDLGKVNIKIDIKDHNLKLSMTAEHHTAKELLLNNIHELKEALVQHGVKLEKVDVQINHNFGQSLNASKEGTDSRQEWRQEFNEEEFSSDNHTEGPHERLINMSSGSNLLHLVA